MLGALREGGTRDAHPPLLLGVGVREDANLLPLLLRAPQGHRPQAGLGELGSGRTRGAGPVLCASRAVKCPRRRGKGPPNPPGVLQPARRAVRGAWAPPGWLSVDATGDRGELARLRLLSSYLAVGLPLQAGAVNKQGDSILCR